MKATEAIEFLGMLSECFERGTVKAFGAIPQMAEYTQEFSKVCARKLAEIVNFLEAQEKVELSCPPQDC